MASTTQKLELGFYDPHTRRSVVGYQPDGSPLWLTWRDSGGVLLVGDTGAGRTYLLNKLLDGVEGDVDVTTFNVATVGSDGAVAHLRDIVRSFAQPAPARPRLVVVHAVEALTRSKALELWEAATIVARIGRTHNVAVLVSAQSAYSTPYSFTESAATILALRQRDSRNAGALPYDMRAAVRVTAELPHGQFPLVMFTRRSGVETTFPLPEPHTACDCVARATALLDEHAAHSAA